MNLLGSRRESFVFLIDFELQQPQVWPLNSHPKGDLLFDFQGFSNTTSVLNFGLSGDKPRFKTELLQSPKIAFQKQPVSFNRFQRAFELVKTELYKGNSFLTNLTAKTRIETSLTLQEIFWQSRAKYKVWHRLAAGEVFEFVCFSPETFIRIQNDWIASFPMKGTINASVPDAEEIILADAKELYEHATIVDLIRNDLALITTQRQVERFRYVEKITTHDKNLLQVSSEIRGKLPENWREDLGSLLFCLLPAGSISGAPKTRTLEVIRQAEGEPRGYYTGICGYFDGDVLDSGVMIRFIEQTQEGLFFRSGGGITFLSEAEKEYQEMIDKVYLPI